MCGESIRRVYLDTCAWCRPFDDPSHPRILQESDAVAEIFKKIDSGEFEIIDSSALHAEISMITPKIKEETVMIENEAELFITTDDIILNKANCISTYKITVKNPCEV